MTDNQPARPVAVLGTGLIGAAVARNLARKGFEVRAWNRSADKARALAADGVTPFDHATDAVRDAGIVVTVLKDGPAVIEAIAAARPGLAKGAIWLQLSTVGAEAIDTLAGLAAENGLVFYDAPVQGTRQPAEQGKLVILASGPDGGREAAQSIFDAIGQRTLWVSDTPGASSRLKLALNAFVFALTHGTAESLAIATALGVDPALVIGAVTGGPLDSGYFQGKGAAMLKGDHATSFSVENGVKDAKLVVEALAGTNVRADLAEAGLARFQRAADAGHGERDIAASFLA
ncbi:NAD(P)-dependent oxidoreductase [Microvirga tunisiensis]|uniref:NAD(P)-dependent oxidoreductase n=1 Tax=Microvirga tunisiensis TaxID=2108360 RepID=A0A5N7MG31_9HYPH|nr:NAD(P)-dependent oxidoreductase [Microvirga tunisiensis]MPR07516.1 NAD(P)-dependent oxidoreductase [Microvirga tunisiensis]MPR25783.1 NAD(P)-dependent oxidoreductase [Microvirga tunisiensis]